METKMEQFPATNPNPVLSAEKDGIVLYSNMAGEPLLHEWGVSVGEKLPPHIENIVHRTISLKSPEKIEVKAGNRVYLVSFHPLPEEECVNIYGFDISDQKELEEKLRVLQDEVQYLKVCLEEPEELQLAVREGDMDALVMPVSEEELLVFTLNSADSAYRMLLETTNEDMVIVDAEFKITYAGKRLINKIGYNQEEVIGRSWLDFIDESSKAVAKQGMKQILQGIDESYELKLICKNSSPYWALISAKPLFDNAGKFKGILGMLTDITERKRAEETLRESEMRYRMLFDKSMDGILLTDTRGVGIILSANPAACRMLGWIEEELILKGLDEIFYVKNPAISTLLDENIPSGSAKSQVNYRHKDGTILTGEVSSTFFIDRNGEPRTVSIIRDITERKRAEEALREAYENLQVQNEELQAQSEELLEANEALCESEERERARSDELAIVLDSVPVAVWIAYDPQALHITGNKLSYEWLQIPEGVNASKSAPEGERPETFRMFKDGVEIPPEDMPVQMSARGTEINNYDFDFVYPGGEVRHVLGNARPLHDKQGNPRGSVSAFIDITERKRAEEALRESEEKYRNIVETTNEGIWVVDAELRTTYVNKKLLEMLGYSLEEMVGKYGLDFTDEENKAILKQTLEERQLGISEIYELKLIRKDGSPIWMLVNTKSIFDENGKFAGSLGMLTDITKIKRAEEALWESEARRKVAEAVLTERERLNSVLDKLPVYTILLSSDYHVPFANRFFEERFGKSEGQRCYEYLFQRTEPCENCETYKVLKTGASHHWE